MYPTFPWQQRTRFLLIVLCFAVFLATGCATNGLRAKVWYSTTYIDIRDEYLVIVKDPNTTAEEKEYLMKHVGPVINLMKYSILAVEHYKQGKWAQFRSDLEQIYKRVDYVARDITDLLIALDQDPIDQTTVGYELTQLQNLVALLSPSYFGRFKVNESD